MKHDVVEKNGGLMIILIIVAISFGTLVELVPLFFPNKCLNPLPA
ncbi:MAG: cytochrome c oxidase cbb3-type subunit 2 [Halieaceae bacterium]|jgi:cytochrome c oxidase cbb3-type subunit 2